MSVSFSWSYSADAIERAFQILDQIPGRATGAYSHSQVTMPHWSLLAVFVQGCYFGSNAL